VQYYGSLKKKLQNYLMKFNNKKYQTNSYIIIFYYLLIPNFQMIKTSTEVQRSLIISECHTQRNCNEELRMYLRLKNFVGKYSFKKAVLSHIS